MYAYHPSNKKMSEVCNHYKEHLPVIKRDDLCNLNECLVLEIRIGGEKRFFFMFIWVTKSRSGGILKPLCRP